MLQIPILCAVKNFNNITTMQYSEMLAAIHQMEKQLSALKEMVLLSMHESESVNESKETPVINEEPVEEPVMEEREELPAPPEVIYVDMPKEEPKADDEVILGCQIITSLPDFYSGECRLIKLHKRYFDNGQPKLYIDKYHVVIEAYDINMKLLGSHTTHWNNLSKFHVELIKRGINKHNKDNWKPNTVCLDLD